MELTFSEQDTRELISNLQDLKTRQAVAKEIFEKTEQYFVDTVEPDGVIMHHIDDTEWKSKIKYRFLGVKDGK